MNKIQRLFRKLYPLPTCILAPTCRQTDRKGIATRRHSSLKIAKLYLVSFAILCIGCAKTDHTVVNLNGNRIDALGHGGMGISSSYPTNTFESISACLARGADGTELDVQLTADGVLVAFHDSDLSESTNNSGRINDLDWADIEGSYYEVIPYHDYEVIRLESLFANTTELETYVFALDCKLITNQPADDYLQQFTSALLDLFDRFPLSEKTIVESPDPTLLLLLHQQQAPCQLFWYVADLETALEAAEPFPVDGFTIANDQVDADAISQAHQQGFQVALYNTQSKKDNIEAIEKNPDYIQTDRLDHLLKVLR